MDSSFFQRGANFCHLKQILVTLFADCQWRGGRRGKCKSGTKFIDCLRDDDDGPEAYCHHDKFPPWWESVRDVDGGNLSVTKFHHR